MDSALPGFMRYLTDEIAGQDASISWNRSPHAKKASIFNPSDLRRLKRHEAIFKGLDGERVIGPAKIHLKAYWKARGGSHFEEEGWRGGCQPSGAVFGFS